MQIGLIFDWDGVIINSADAHKAAWENLAEQENLYLPKDHFERTFGKRNAEIIPNILNWSSDSDRIEFLSEQKELLYRKNLELGMARILPGVNEFLQQANDQNIPCAVGSSTSRENILAGMDLGNLHKLFASIVSAEDVSEGKPNPEVFLKAANSLNIQPSRCTVFEDSPFGVEAAKSAGMVAVGVFSTSHGNKSLKDADRMVHQLNEISLHELKSFFT